MITFTVSLLTLYSAQYLNVPYKWAGNDFTAFDCSGLVQKVLKDVGYLKDDKDRTAQQLFNYLSVRASLCDPQVNSLVFFGSGMNRITHVGIAINEDYMISASSGDINTNTLEDAIIKDARVKITKIYDRGDYLTALKIEGL